jgi:hypothetical protein
VALVDWHGGRYMAVATPVLVLIDDEPYWLETLTRVLRDLDPAHRVEVVTFTNNTDATRFVVEHAADIIGYIQDLNRGPSHEYTGGLEGIAFFNDVIVPRTPLAKTLIFSAAVTKVQVRDLYYSYSPPGQLRISFKNEGYDEEPFRSNVEWLLTPTVVDERSADSTDSKLIHSLAQPWSEVRRAIAANSNLLYSLDARVFEE